MTIPARSMTDFILVQSRFTFADFKTLLNRPAHPGDGDQGLQGSVRRCKDHKIGEFTVAQTSPDQSGMEHVSRLSPAWQEQQRPVIDTRPFGARATTQGLPGVRRQRGGTFIRALLIKPTPQRFVFLDP